MTSIKEWVLAKENIFRLLSKNVDVPSSFVTNFWKQMGAVLSKDLGQKISFDKFKWTTYLIYNHIDERSSIRLFD